MQRRTSRAPMPENPNPSDGGFRRWIEADGGDISPADVRIVTSGWRSIPAHSAVLAAASPVLETMLNAPTQPQQSRWKVIRIRGIPHDAISAFVRFLYCSRSLLSKAEVEIGKHGMHLLVLSHVYQVPWLKHACVEALAANLTTDTVVDVLVLARQCDAPSLYLRCMKLLTKNFNRVEQSEAWIFLQDNDPRLELEILKFIQDAHSRQKRQRRKREEQRLYMELSEAMECLEHICTEGCTKVSPSHREPAGKPATPCSKPDTCHGFQQLILHFASCERKKLQHGCKRCKRLWQLLRLHASICNNPEPCKVPLCMQFKQRMQEEGGGKEKDGGDEEKWRLLVKKVVLARVMCHLVKRKNRAEEVGTHRTAYIQTN